MNARNAKVYFICCFFGIGNSILFYPVIKTIKKINPNAKIIIGALRHRNEEYFTLLPEVDEIVVLNSIRKAYLDIAKLLSLYSKSIDTLVVPYLSENNYAWLISRCVGAASVGYDQKGRSYDIVIPLEEKHELEINMDIIRVMFPGSEKQMVKDCNPGIVGGEESAGKKWIGFHAAAHNSMLEKCWAYANFVTLGKLLQKHYSADTYLFGGDTSNIDEFNSADFTVNYAGKLDLKGTMKQIAEMDLFITNDSGLMHIAASLGVPVVSIFGPTDEFKNAPFIEKKLIITEDLECRPCYKPWAEIICNQEISYKCLKEIAPEEVFEKIKEQNFL